MKVALVHDWLTGMRGGEKCLEAFCELFPDAPIFTLIYVKGSVSSIIERHRIIPSLLSHFPRAATWYRYYLPLFPFAIQSFDLRGYDMILSSSHCVAKGVQVPANTFHISYLHSPMRYVWDQYDQYFGKGKCSGLVRIMMSMLRPRLQHWDSRSNKHVHSFLANSQNVSERISRYYGRMAFVVHPPVEWKAFQASKVDEGFYLMVTAFAPYKRIDLAIEAANTMGFPLKIIGQGQEEKRLKQMAGPTVEFLGWQADEQVRAFYSRCRAVLFPGEEDFGIVPLEAMASGKPVIAYGKGGVLETVIPLDSSSLTPKEDVTFTGIFFYEQSVEAIIKAIRNFEKHQGEFCADAIRAHVETFDQSYFKQRVQQVIFSSYEEFRRSHSC
ncbi:MAG: glycosyltransferase [Nitrospirales bacterium]